MLSESSRHWGLTRQAIIAAKQSPCILQETASSWAPDCVLDPREIRESRDSVSNHSLPLIYDPLATSPVHWNPSGTSCNPLSPFILLMGRESWQGTKWIWKLCLWEWFIDKKMDVIWSTHSKFLPASCCVVLLLSSLVHSHYHPGHPFPLLHSQLLKTQSAFSK